MTSMTDAVIAKANDIYERAAKGENFATLADTLNEEVNLPPRADEGGMPGVGGCFRIGRVVREV